MEVLQDVYRPQVPAGRQSFRTFRSSYWRLDHPGRGSAWLLALACAVTLGAGVLQLHSNFTVPRAASVGSKGVPASTPLTQAGASAVQAGGADTDDDGLTDEQERTYQTSAYVEDSDSDGTSDAEEVRLGTDPNCPPHTVCARPADAPPPAGNEVENPTASLVPAALRQYPDGSGQERGSAGTTAVPSLSASSATVREFLLTQGVPADLLQQVSDSELAQVLEETLAANEQSP